MILIKLSIHPETMNNWNIWNIWFLTLLFAGQCPDPHRDIRSLISIRFLCHPLQLDHQK